eukprot:CAMPEP_0184753230 /NCGR_PEP_ID=MMETSP0315-20130426/43992_1 /TAXON_ID=101924 /ORGANISM="Rhodosorus marinus, Strain UTEX LB 2760" /LENGTH=296 /DNA_ID=CAMNT_0027232599 /DNA_START=807 /DNA_END=1695 /DNA_ORIENTATION=-
MSASPAIAFGSVFLLLFVFYVIYETTSWSGDPSTQQKLNKVNFAGDSKYVSPPGTGRSAMLTLRGDGSHSMRYITGGTAGSKKPTFILIHGASSKQNAEYWEPNFQLLSSFGQFYALDCFGHGSSTGSPSSEKDVVAIKELIAEEGINDDIVFVARSAGGAKLMRVLEDEEIAAKVDRLILIAPAIAQTTVPAAAKGKKVLLFWAEKDPVISERNADLVASSFNEVTRYTFQGIESHVPEMLAPEVFQEQISQFLFNERSQEIEIQGWVLMTSRKERDGKSESGTDANLSNNQREW